MTPQQRDAAAAHRSHIGILRFEPFQRLWQTQYIMQLSKFSVSYVYVWFR